MGTQLNKQQLTIAKDNSPLHCIADIMGLSSFV